MFSPLPRKGNEALGLNATAFATTSSATKGCSILFMFFSLSGASSSYIYVCHLRSHSDLTENFEINDKSY